MQGTQQDSVIPKKRSRSRKKFECSKCEVHFVIANVPEGWLVVWDDKLGKFTHYCVGCQGGRRTRKKS
jgi:hypothetical protein